MSNSAVTRQNHLKKAFLDKAQALQEECLSDPLQQSLPRSFALVKNLIYIAPVQWKGSPVQWNPANVQWKGSPVQWKDQLRAVESWSSHWSSQHSLHARADLYLRR